MNKLETWTRGDAVGFAIRSAREAHDQRGAYPNDAQALRAYRANVIQTCDEYSAGYVTTHDAIVEFDAEAARLFA